MIKIKKILILFVLILFIVSCAQQQDIQPEEPEPEVTEPTPEETPVEEPTPKPEETIEEQPEETQVTAPQETFPENLVAYWKFDDDLKDATGNYDGTIVGQTSFSEGKKDKALYLDNSYVDLPLNDIGSLTQGTIAFWFNYESILETQTLMPIFYIGMEQGQDNMFLIEIGHSGGAGGEGSGSTPDPTNKMLYSTWVKNGAEPFLCYDSTDNLEENTWHHFAVTVGPDGNAGYLNGEEMTNRDYNFGSSSDKAFFDDIPVKEQMTIGYGRSSFMISPDFIYYKGLIDDFRIYNEPLSAEEIQELI